MKTFIKTTLFTACLFMSLFLFADSIPNQGSIASTIPDYTCNIRLAIPAGEYQLLMIHYYGTLSGTFDIAE
jgi:hypothetical protein